MLQFHEKNMFSPAKRLKKQKVNKNPVNLQSELNASNSKPEVEASQPEPDLALSDSVIEPESESNICSSSCFNLKCNARRHPFQMK